MTLPVLFRTIAAKTAKIFNGNKKRPSTFEATPLLVNNYRRHIHNTMEKNDAQTEGSVKFQLMSDLHIEFFRDEVRIPAFEAKAPYVALVGDIGNSKNPNYEKFLEEQSKKFKEVFVVAGNHEYYTRVYEDEQVRLQQICDKFSNVHFMQKKSMKLGKYRVLGTTLWSFVPEENTQQVQKGLNDYAMISKRDGEKFKKIHVTDTNAWHKDELEWLTKEINAAKEAKEEIIVMTHHAPTTNKTSAPVYDNSPINCAFSTNLEYLLGPHIKAWFYGHTHYSNDQMINGTRVVSNQLGYVLHREDSRYRTEFTVEIN